MKVVVHIQDEPREVISSLSYRHNKEDPDYPDHVIHFDPPVRFINNNIKTGTLMSIDCADGTGFRLLENIRLGELYLASAGPAHRNWKKHNDTLEMPGTVRICRARAQELEETQ